MDINLGTFVVGVVSTSVTTGAVCFGALKYYIGAEIDRRLSAHSAKLHKRIDNLSETIGDVEVALAKQPDELTRRINGTYVRSALQQERNEAVDRRLDTLEDKSGAIDEKLVKIHLDVANIGAHLARSAKGAHAG